MHSSALYPIEAIGTTSMSETETHFQLTLCLIELFGIEVRAGGGGGFLYTLGI